MTAWDRDCESCGRMMPDCICGDEEPAMTAELHLVELIYTNIDTDDEATLDALVQVGVATVEELQDGQVVLTAGVEAPTSVAAAEAVMDAVQDLLPDAVPVQAHRDLIRFTKPCDDCAATGRISSYLGSGPIEDVGPCPSCAGGWLPSDETVEAAAKAGAIADPEWRNYNEWESLSPVTKKGYRRMASAALVAAARYQSEKKQ